MFFIIFIFLLILIIIILGYFLLHKLESFLGVSLSSIIKQSKLEDENIPKSLSGMDSLCLPRIKEDFSDLNINELKRECEKNILMYLKAIESKDSSKIKNDKIRAFVDTKIMECGKNNIHFKKIKFHKTVVSRYENNYQIATITFGTSLEYLIYIDGAFKRKEQQRFRIEYIYILDSSIVNENSKVIGINCPNCGSVHFDFKNHRCRYCGTYIKDIVKRVWYCNDLTSY